MRAKLLTIFAGTLGVAFGIILIPTLAALASQALSICQIQGSGKTTPHAGKQVQTDGIVTADFDNQSERGFFLQKENCDGNEATSDGIFVYLGEMMDVVDVGM